MSFLGSYPYLSYEVDWMAHVAYPSLVNCQKACKKCDDGRPCQRCIKLGLTATCTNSPRKERKKGVKRGPYKKRQTAHQQQQEQGVIGTSTFNTNNDMYQQPLNITPPLTTNTSPLSSSPLSADLGYNYLATTHDVASSASASSLSPVSPHFPQLAWENNPRQYDGLWQDAPGIDNTNVMVQHLDAPITNNNTMTTTTAFDSLAYNNMVKSQQQQPYDFLYMEDPCIMTSDDNTWAMYSQQQQQQQQVQYYQQPQSTGYWQTFLANA